VNSYQGPELELYLEALRVVPALTSARVRSAKADGMALRVHYIRLAGDLGIPDSTAWSILATASDAVILGLVNLVAEIEEVSALNVAERMVLAALDQVASGAV
jgi:hypothetical protein